MATLHVALSRLGVILVFFIFSATCEHFEFNNCLLLDLDATFELSMGAQIADPFDLEGSNVTSTQTLCGSDTTSGILTIRLFPSDEPLKINFRRDTNMQTVSMSVALTLDPKKHFENASEILPFELEDSDDLPIGLMNMSYKCMYEQQILFNQDPGYSMTMKITNLQVQAYNVEGGQYSQAMECAQDMMTTTPSAETTTEPETTVMPETTTPNTPTTIIPRTTTPETATTIGPETTSETPETEPTTTSPEPETTTPEVVPTTRPRIIPKYEIKDGDNVCIVLQGVIRFDIEYEKNDGQMAEQGIEVPEDAKPDGQCADGNDSTTQLFKLTFFDDKWSFSVAIAEDEQTLLRKALLRELEAAPSYSWKTVNLTYVLDENFVEPKESDIGQEQTVTKEEGDGYFKADNQGSYKCSTGESLELAENVRMDLGDFQYRAFGQDNSGNFTNGDVAKCPSDWPPEVNDHKTIIIYLLIAGGTVMVVCVASAVLYCRMKRNKYKYVPGQNIAIAESQVDNSNFAPEADCDETNVPGPSHAASGFGRRGRNEVSGRRIHVNGKKSNSIKDISQRNSDRVPSNVDQRPDEKKPMLKFL